MKNVFAFSLIGLSYAPILFRLTMHYPSASVIALKMLTDVAFISFCWLLFTGFRQGIMRRLFNENLLGKFHITLGLVAACLVLVHPIGIALLYSDWTIIIPFVHPYGVLVSLGSIALLLLTVTVVSSHLIRQSHYDLWNLLHYLNYVFFILIFIHALSALPLRTPIGIYYVILFGIGTLVMITKFLFDLELLSLKTSIRDMKLIATDTYSLRFPVPADLLKTWQAGQYVMVGLTRFGDNHPMSLSDIDLKTMTAEVTFKVFGNFTQLLCQKTNDDILYVAGSYGRLYHALQNTHHPLVFIAGGIGITPFRSIITDQLRTSPNREIYLLYCAQDESFLAFHDDFIQIAQTNPQFHYKAVRTNTDGYITAGMIGVHVLNVTDKEYYLCGPTNMMSASQTILQTLGVPKSKIHIEEFGY